MKIDSYNQPHPNDSAQGYPVCFHCGELCATTDIIVGDKHFCCKGCRTVYELLDANDLCNYYTLDRAPGVSPQEFGADKRFGYLDDAEVQNQLLDFNDGRTAKATFFIPEMHCAACIWLLENLYTLNPAVTQSKVNFLKKELTVTWHIIDSPLRELVTLLASIGYEPRINLQDLERQAEDTSNKSLYYKIGIAGFAFGNIMLLSFPEYLSSGGAVDPWLRKMFGYIILILALPVMIYSASEYWQSAWKGLRKGIVNMDVPISLGIFTLFIRSTYEILTQSGAGFFDSMTGLVFLLLIGKIFQKKTYDTLSFDRNYKAYFPVSVTRLTGGEEISTPVGNLHPKDRILIRNHELVPADAVLIRGSGNIDYSFVTGESDPVKKAIGDEIFAGGRQVGGAIELDVVREVSQSYLTRLWNNDTFTQHSKNSMVTLANQVSKYFTAVVIFLAFVAGLYWLPDQHLALKAFTAVLIVACPCALALSTPFALGSALRIFGRRKFFLRNTEIAETLAKIDTIVFDKTGTLTRPGQARIRFTGEQLDAHQQVWIKSVARHSNHPLSHRIYQRLPGHYLPELANFSELSGEGVMGEVDGHLVKLGRYEWVADRLTESGVGDPEATLDPAYQTAVYVAIDGEVLGYFTLTNDYRPEMDGLIKELSEQYDLALLSGDNDRERPRLAKIFTKPGQLLFNQSPVNKLDYIKSMREQGRRVLMIGDGLNDAGALAASDVGIALTEDLTSFSPACDAILDAKHLKELPIFLAFAGFSRRLVIASFGLSFLYNAVGLSFAVAGMLSPLVSAILMPLSSISVVVFTTAVTRFRAMQLRWV